MCCIKFIQLITFMNSELSMLKSPKTMILSYFEWMIESSSEHSVIKAVRRFAGLYTVRQSVGGLLKTKAWHSKVGYSSNKTSL